MKIKNRFSKNFICSLIILLTITNIQCKKKKEEPASSSSNSTSSQQNTGRFEFKGNGVEYKFNKMVAAYQNSSNLSVSAAGETGYQAFIDISNFNNVGTNPITSGFAVNIYFPNNVAYGILPGSNLYGNSHGTIQITETITIDGKIYAKGTFSGVAYRNGYPDSLVITEGYFQDKNFK